MIVLFWGYNENRNTVMSMMLRNKRNHAFIDYNFLTALYIKSTPDCLFNLYILS